MQFLHAEDEHKELTYEDVFLMPRYTEVTSRMDVDLRPSGVEGLQIPIVVANMTAVAGRRMAETVARRGGLVVLPQDMPLERMEQIVAHVQSCHQVYETPVVLKKDETVQTALNLIYKRAHRGVIVVDDANHPVGIFTEADGESRDRFHSLEDAMTKDVVTIPEHFTPREIFELLHTRRLSFAPVVNRDGVLVGAMTKKGVLRSFIYKPAVNSHGKLMTAVAVGINRDVEARVRRLMEIGVDVIVLDTAHGHQKRMLESIKLARQILGPYRPLVAGNIASEQAASDFIDAGASILKVGIGPGAMCTTRMMTGVGRPQFTNVYQLSKVARNKGAYVWADGGIKHPRDVSLAIAAGASCAFFGSWWAGTYESPADMQVDEQGRQYKENYGMASHRAVVNRNEKLDAYEVAKREFFEEGISQSRMYLKDREKSAEDILDRITAGLRSTCTYMGAMNLEDLHKNAIVGVQTNAGYREGQAYSNGW
ncbi:MAG: GuaB1 family IMP dehydrogenase-related protein [Patescibacteria group bacterium]